MLLLLCNSDFVNRSGVPPLCFCNPGDFPRGRVQDAEAASDWLSRAVRRCPRARGQLWEKLKKQPREPKKGQEDLWLLIFIHPPHKVGHIQAGVSAYSVHVSVFFTLYGLACVAYCNLMYAKSLQTISGMWFHIYLYSFYDLHLFFFWLCFGFCMFYR